MLENSNFYNMSDYEKEIYIEKNLWNLDRKLLKEFIKFDNFNDDRVYSKLRYDIISNMDYLTQEKIDMLYYLFEIDLRDIKLLVDKINVNISDVMDLSYDKENELYCEDVNSLYSILKKIDDIEEAKDAIGLYNEVREREYFKKFKNKFHNLDDLYNFKKYEKEFYDDIFFKTKNITNKKRILLSKCFNVDIKKVKELLDKIHENGMENKFEDYAFLMNIIKSIDIEEINYLYLHCKENYSLFEEMLTDYKIYCMKDVADVANNIKFPTEFKEINDIKIYDFSNTEFNLLIHRTNAVSNNFWISPEKFANYSNKNGKNTISCSAISDLFLGRVEHEENNVYFGFSDINESDILDMGPENINMTDEINSHMPSSISGEQFMRFSKLTEYTFDQYNEVALFRNNQNTGELKKPTYIVCFDEVDKYSIEVAKKMKLPIVYINTKIVYENGRKKINEMIENALYYSSDEKNLELGNKILSFAYGAYCSGRKELDENALSRFFEKTIASKLLSEEYKKHAIFRFKKLNNNIGFGFGDKYRLSRD